MSRGSLRVCSLLGALTSFTSFTSFTTPQGSAPGPGDVRLALEVRDLAGLVPRLAGRGPVTNRYFAAA